MELLWLVSPFGDRSFARKKFIPDDRPGELWVFDLDYRMPKLNRETETA